MTIHVRPFDRADADTLARVFFRAIQEGTVGAYSAAQRDAWAGLGGAPPSWADRLAAEITLVGERNGTVAGFMTLGRDAYLDLAFVLPEEMGRGLAAALHDRVLHEAQARDMTRLTTEASIVARRFFLKQGWRQLTEQQVNLRGTLLTNYWMEKRLAPSG